MTYYFDADLFSVYKRLSQKETNDVKHFASIKSSLSKKDEDFDVKSFENSQKPSPALMALMRGEIYISPDIEPHKYIPETTAGIGFCQICYNDDRNHPIHIKE